MIASELDRHNRERQAIEASILQSADDLAERQRDNPFLLVGGDDWHPGVVGIIAGRLKDRHAKPALVAGFQDSGSEAIGRGSARSVSGVDLGAMIRAAHAEGILEAGGGHAMAAGFTIRRSRLPAFATFLGTRIDRGGHNFPDRDLLADAILSATGADLNLLSHVDRAGPYGAGNPEPQFALSEMLVVYAGIVGGKHVRLRAVGRDGQGIGAIAFRAVGTELGTALLHARGQRVHLLGKLKSDDYDGVPKAQLHIEDAAPA
jgi:single-stranded-DNA-specific exonuclease